MCMSEHEGFCVPLVEAMFFETPIVAYASTAIPGTLGGSGVLVETKEPEAVAEKCIRSLRIRHTGKKSLKSRREDWKIFHMTESRNRF